MHIAADSTPYTCKLQAALPALGSFSRPESLLYFSSARSTLQNSVNASRLRKQLCATAKLQSRARTCTQPEPFRQLTAMRH